MRKGIIFYTDNRLNLKIAHEVQKRLSNISKSKNFPIVSSSLKKMSFGNKNIHFPHLKRGTLTMFKQIMAALEHSDSDVIFFCEHDVLYHPSHFDFTPPKDNVYYYNTNVWRVRLSDYFSFRMDNARQTSGLCGYRELLLGHYQRRIAKILQNQEDVRALGLPIVNDAFSRHMGYEPGLHMNPRGVDDFKPASWESSYPNIDIRHDANFTRTRWSPKQFHDKNSITGWVESKADDIPGWHGLEKTLDKLKT